MSTIALLFDNYGPYHLARFEALQQECRSKNLNVVGIELARVGNEYPWQTKLANFSDSIISLVESKDLEKTKGGELIKLLYSVLSKVQPDVLVIAGYYRSAMLAAWLWSICHRKPAILLSESKEDDFPRSWWNETLKRFLFKGYQSALVGGKIHKRYLVKLGMKPDSIFFGYDVVGNKAFDRHKISLLPNPCQKPYFLAINRFISKKNLFNLICAYAAYRQKSASDPWDLILCGDGELRPQIEQQINELGLNNCVHLPGFLQQDELLPYFAHASCFIHASIQEQWGLVVNEAMAAGLPVLVSNRCGCFEDLVLEKVNGFGFDPENIQNLTDLMLKMSSDAVDLKAMGRASLEHIQNFSPDYFAQGLIEATKYALAHF